MSFRFKLLLGALLVLTLVSAAAWAQDTPVHRIASETKKVELVKAAGVWQDADGTLSVEQVAALANRGQLKTVAYPQGSILRSNADNTLWLKFELAADATAPRDWLLVVGWPNHEHVRLFTLQGDGHWQPSPDSGATVALSDRAMPDRNFLFPVHIAPGQTRSLLLRIQDTGEAPITATLWQPAAWQASEKLTERLFSLYFGLAGGMLMYNLLLYLVLKDRRFLIYAGFIASLALALTANMGYGAQYLWGDWAWWNSRSTNFGFAACALFSSTLTRVFLSTRTRLPAGDAMMAGVVTLAACALVASLTLPNYIATGLVLLSLVGTMLMTGGLSIFAVSRGWPGAKYFCAAWFAMHLGTLTALASFFRLIPHVLIAPEAVAIGSAMEMILLSLALADRINEERRQKERAQAQTLAVLQASHALNSETRLDPLHARLCEVMAGLTGATAVHFVLNDGDEDRWLLFGSAREGERIDVREAGRMGLLPLSVFTHVETTREALVVHDALADERFAADVAFNGISRCAVLALPIVRQRALIAVLVLENRLARGAFSDVALGAVDAVAGPLAVALENVLLYEHLEQRVAEQTRELRETQQELVATARRAGMAEVANNILHNVGNVLNSVNVSAGLVASKVRGSKNRGLVQAVDLMNAHAGDIGDFMSRDQRGMLLPGYLNKLVEALAQERDEVDAELGRMMRNVDHIKAVVATQQSHAGASSVLEMEQPCELVEEALHMNAGQIESSGVMLVREFGDLPRIAMDKPRVLQILVNLIRNATQAMAAIAPESRKLTLACAMAQIENGNTLRITVRDQGEGIAARDMERIFAHGFTTRADGHGFGLHSSALAAMEMGGKLAAHSDGPGQGALFTLELPVHGQERRE